MALELDSTFSTVSWQFALRCVNITDLDIPESPHVKKMTALTTNLLKEHGGYLRQLASRVQLKNHSPCETIHNVSNELFDDGTINWGRIVALYTFVRLFVKSLCKSGQQSYNYILRTKMTVASEVYQYMDLHLRSWITANGGWVS